MDAKPKIDIYTPEEVAVMLRLERLGFNDPVSTVKIWASRKIIGCVHVGRHVMFRLEHVEQYLEREQMELKPRRRRPARSI